MRIIEVTGPPCSGKSMYVMEHCVLDDDMIIDWDRLAVALGWQGREASGHDSPPWMKPFQQVARDALYLAVARMSMGRVSGPMPGAVWVIATRPAPLVPHDRVVMDTPLDVCLQRAQEAGRPPEVARAIRLWFAEREGVPDGW